MRILRRALRIIEEDVPAYSLAVIAALILTDVFGRYVFNSPLRAASELSLIIIVWVVFLTTASLIQRGMHIAVDSLYVLMGGTVRYALDLFSELLLIGVFGFVGWHATNFVMTGHFIILPASGLSKRFVTLAIVVGMGLSIVHSLVRVVLSTINVIKNSSDYHRLYDPYEIEPLEDLDTRGVNVLQEEFEKKVMS